MYYYINGLLTLLNVDSAVLDCSGVGYFLSISKTTYDTILKENVFAADGTYNQTKIKLYTYQNVREDSIELFGFFTEDECKLFKLLISVSGIGPKAGLSILSTLSVGNFLRSVAANDSKAISAAPGIGLKTAQKVILELKDKLEKGIIKGSDELDFSPAESELKNVAYEEARDALVVLGYSKAQAMSALQKAKGENTEDIIRDALRIIMK